MNMIGHNHEFIQIVTHTIEIPQCIFDGNLQFRFFEQTFPITLIKPILKPFREFLVKLAFHPFVMRFWMLGQPIFFFCLPLL